MPDDQEQSIEQPTTETPAEGAAPETKSTEWTFTSEPGDEQR